MRPGECLTIRRLRRLVVVRRSCPKSDEYYDLEAASNDLPAWSIVSATGLVVVFRLPSCSGDSIYILANYFLIRLTKQIRWHLQRLIILPVRAHNSMTLDRPGQARPRCTFR